MSIAAIALAASAVGALVWVVKYFAKTLSVDLREHTKAAVAQTAASIGQKKSNDEVLVYLKALNGKVAKITAQTIEEQHVINQTVDNTNNKE